MGGAQCAIHLLTPPGLSMSRKLLMTVALATAPIVVFATQQGNAEPWKPTIEDARKLVDAIGSEEDKLKTYCEINKTHEALDKAEEAGDAKAFDVGVAKLDILEPQMGPDYLRMMEGLGEVDPNSLEGQKFTAVFEPLHKQCGEAPTKP
jgi:hypothetical protein